jgi:site-specific DNA-methyltransferase (adenine-specific)/modification methylase
MSCVDGMRLMKDDSVDIVITSPPYNLKDAESKYDQYADNMTDEDYYNFIKDVITELIRVTKYFVFFNFQFLSNNKITYLRIMNDFRDNVKDIIIWHKNQALPSPANCLTNTYEFVVVFTKKDKAKGKAFDCEAFDDYTKKFSLSTNVISGGGNAQESNELNKACFPSYFVEWFVRRFTNEDSVVLDPFMGSGTTALICCKYRRKYIGFEVSKAQCDYANERIKKWSLQPRISDYLTLKRTGCNGDEPEMARE